jgi:hypothetical protein
MTMNKKDRDELKRLERFHGVPAVLAELHKICVAATKDYPPDAIIHQYAEIVGDASEACLDCIRQRVELAASLQSIVASGRIEEEARSQGVPEQTAKLMKKQLGKMAKTLRKQ